LNKSLVLEAITAIIWKITMSCWSMSSKISFHHLKMKWNHQYLESLRKTSFKAWNENKKWWKEEGKKKGKPIAYIVHMGG
jgi:hypothetical protein